MGSKPPSVSLRPEVYSASGRLPCWENSVCPIFIIQDCAPVRVGQANRMADGHGGIPPREYSEYRQDRAPHWSARISYTHGPNAPLKQNPGLRISGRFCHVSKCEESKCGESGGGDGRRRRYCYESVTGKYDVCYGPWYLLNVYSQ